MNAVYMYTELLLEKNNEEKDTEDAPSLSSEAS